MTPQLRIIRDDDRKAGFNMAADLFLADNAAVRNMIALRFYSWAPPAISLGYMQKDLAILDREAMTRAGIALVTRPTGGRAVLHEGDLTYACVFPRAVQEMGGSINESYAVISRCLRRGLELAGITAATHDTSSEYQASKRIVKLPCFLAPNRNEIMVRGRKLVGSAQKRTAGAVLQHGSIPFDASFRRLPEFMAVPPDERARMTELLGKKCVCVKELASEIDMGLLTDCLVRGFTETLPFPAFEKRWDEEEVREIERRVHP
jgi:lipoyl(octanoyl) transferase